MADSTRSAHKSAANATDIISSRLKNLRESNDEIQKPMGGFSKALMLFAHMQQ